MASERIVLVQDALPFLGGAERVLEAVLKIYPAAPLYTLVHNKAQLAGTLFDGHEIHTSWVNRLPGARNHYRRYLPLFPFAIEQFDLRRFNLILSFNYAVAHGVVPRPDQLHISYTYTPLRYIWHQFHTYRQFATGIKAWLAGFVLHYLRLWDFSASSRVDHFVAISQWVADCIWRAYRRSADVIYPPVDVSRYQPIEPRDDYYISVSRLAPHKNVALTVAAFSRLGYPLYVVGEGSELDRLRAQAAPNVHLLGRQSQETLAELLGRAKAFIHSAEEDFGIAPVEAQAAGCPVIAYGKGGVRETVLEGKTGIFFHEPTVESLMAAVQEFEASGNPFEIGEMRRNAERFRVERFQREFEALVEREWVRFKNQTLPEREIYRKGY